MTTSDCGSKNCNKWKITKVNGGGVIKANDIVRLENQNVCSGNGTNFKFLTGCRGADKRDVMTYGNPNGEPNGWDSQKSDQWKIIKVGGGTGPLAQDDIIKLECQSDACKMKFLTGCRGGKNKGVVMDTDEEENSEWKIMKSS